MTASFLTCRVLSRWMSAGVGLAAGASLLALPSKQPILAEEASPPSSSTSALDPNEWRLFELEQRQPLTRNTSKFRFKLGNPEFTVGLPVASCLLTKAPIGDNGKPVIRPYTPTSPPDAKGHFDLVVKVYESGVMSRHIGTLKVGDKLAFKGPIIKLKYEPNLKQHIGMVAGGTGITPMLQIISEVLRNPDDKTRLSLIYGSVSEDDIILKKEIDSLAAKHPNFKVHYVVDKTSNPRWSGGVGYITKEMLAKYLPGPGEGTLIVVCGPPPLMNAISGDKAPDKSQGELTGFLKDLGFTPSQVLKM